MTSCLNSEPGPQQPSRTRSLRLLPGESASGAKIYYDCLKILVDNNVKLEVTHLAGEHMSTDRSRRRHQTHRLEVSVADGRILRMQKRQTARYVLYLFDSDRRSVTQQF